MSSPNRRIGSGRDRRRVPRGGRRDGDRPGRHPTVLVADSYAAVRQPCARYFEQYSFRVQEAADGDQAVALITSALPHVIVADASLPIMPAARLAQWLSQNWRTRHIPLIVMTEGGAADPALANAVMLAKPFKLPAMLEKVRKVLRVRLDDSGSAN